MNALVLSLVAVLLSAPAGTSASAAPGAPPQAPPETFLALAGMIAQSGDLATAERVLQDGLAQHPAADGFHLAMGNLLAQKGRTADAFYEFQWEILRATDTAIVISAGRGASDLLDATGPEGEEIRRVVAALEKTVRDPAAALRTITLVQKERGPRFALQVFEAELCATLGEKERAAAVRRELARRDPHFFEVNAVSPNHRLVE